MDSSAIVALVLGVAMLVIAIVGLMFKLIQLSQK